MPSQERPLPGAAPRIELVKNSFDVDDAVFHGLMALGVLKETGIKAKGAQHKRWFQFMQRTGRFSEAPDYPAWSKDEFLEYAGIILAMHDPDVQGRATAKGSTNVAGVRMPGATAHPLYDYAASGVASLQAFSEQNLRDYEHLINVGASINRPPYEIIRI
ncbi:MAG: hypothetical protein M1527_06590 [Gammaproteobacteria bacterium]|nr:hypothetical protein [Gammaproteobacteria bacterium]